MSHLRLGGFGRPWRCKVRLVYGHLLAIFLIAVMPIAGLVLLNNALKNKGKAPAELIPAEVKK